MPENPTQAPPPVQPPPPAPPATPPPSPESQARTWNMLCHLSALACFVFPFGNLLGPLLVWQIKKNEFPSVDIHGKSWMERMRSENAGKLELKDLVPELNETNAPPAAVQQ